MSVQLAPEGSAKEAPEQTASTTVHERTLSQDAIELHDLAETIIKDREETTSTATEEEILDADSSIDSSLLKVEGKGCLGKIERAPLGVKLCGMSICSFIGMAVMGIFLTVQVAITLSIANKSQNLLRVTSDVDEFIDIIAAERTALLSYLTALDLNNTALIQQTASVLEKAQQAVDVNANRLSTAATEFNSDLVKNPIFYQILATIEGLDAQRKQLVERRDFTGSFTIYFNFITIVNGLIERMFVAIPDGSTAGIGYSASITLLETVKMSDLLAKFILERHVTNPETATGMATLYGMFSIALLNFQSVIPEDVFQTYVQTMETPANGKALEVFVAYLDYMSRFRVVAANGTFIEPLYSMEHDAEWFHGNASIVHADFDKIKLKCKGSLDNTITQAVTSGIILLVVVVVLVLVFLVLTLGSSFFFSRTIAGPWLRLNRMQEQTIRKFVPRPLLRLLNCRRITDVKLGISIERDITMMFINITNFASLTQNLKDKDVFRIMNRYLDTVGPIVRKHGGFIDKLLSNRAMALFSHPKKANQAAIAIQQMMIDFNAILKGEGEVTDFQLRISIHSANVAIGTLGEHERLEGAILSKHVDILQRMNQMAETLDLKILVSQESVSSKLPKRFLGNLSFAGETMEVYEVIIAPAEGEPTQEMKRRDAFSNAATNLASGKYEDAQIVFRALVRENPNDKVASHLFNLTNTMMGKVSRAQKEVLVTDTLTDIFLQSAFGAFCSQELSSENFELWKIIEEYKQTAEVTKRQVLAQKINKDFLDVNGSNAVNINAETKKNVIAQIQQEVYQVELFAELQHEIEVVMNDTHKRFKESTLFKQSFTKSIFYPRVLSIDQT